MMFVRSFGAVVLLGAVLVASGCGHTARCGGDRGDVCMVAVGESAGIELGLSVLDGKAGDGIGVRVEIANRGNYPHSLYVCPAMTICCVKNMHVMVSFGDTGIGLRDLCKKTNPTPHEVFLPAGATFGFDMTIPLDCLPEAVFEKGQELSVQLCLDLCDGTQAKSSLATVRL